MNMCESNCGSLCVCDWEEVIGTFDDDEFLDYGMRHLTNAVYYRTSSNGGYAVVGPNVYAITTSYLYPPTATLLNGTLRTTEKFVKFVPFENESSSPKTKETTKMRNCECDCDCDCDWEYVYFHTTSPKDVGLPIYGNFYKTYGGGPEGGYVVSRGKVYAADRKWFEKWTLTELNGVLEVKTEGEATYVKFVRSAENSLPSIIKG